MEHVTNITTRESEKLQARAQLAYDITHKGGQVNPESKAAFYQQGYTDEDLVDLLLELSNATADKPATPSAYNPFLFFAGILRRIKGHFRTKSCP